MAGVVAVWAIPDRVFTYIAEKMHSEETNSQFHIAVPFADVAPGEERIALEKFVIPEDTFITGFSISHTGREHVVEYLDAYYRGAEDPYCAELPLRLYGADHNLRSLTIPEPYGILVKKDERIFLSLVLKNREETMASGAIIVSLAHADNREEVVPVSLNLVDYCKNSEELDARAAFQPRGKPEKAHMERAFFFPAGGHILGWGGDFGALVGRVQLTKGKLIINTLEVPFAFSAFDNPVEFTREDAINIEVTFRDQAKEDGTSASTAYLLITRE